MSEVVYDKSKQTIAKKVERSKWFNRGLLFCAIGAGAVFHAVNDTELNDPQKIGISFVAAYAGYGVALANQKSVHKTLGRAVQTYSDSVYAPGEAPALVPLTKIDRVTFRSAGAYPLMTLATSAGMENGAGNFITIGFAALGTHLFTSHERSLDREGAHAVSQLIFLKANAPAEEQAQI